MTQAKTAQPRKDKFIQNITGKILTTDQDIAINLKSRNLIIIGKNGSGKTSFLTSLFGTLTQNISDGNIEKLSEYRKNLAEAKKNVTKNPAYQGTVEHYEKIIHETTNPLQITYNSPSDFITQHKDGSALVRHYEATRKVSITKVSSASPVIAELPQHKRKENLASNLEQHLVNLEIIMALAMRKNNVAKARKIEEWFVKFQEDLKFLFEDESIHLLFDDERLAFLLKQENRPPYSFQNLSSGYLAIFDIYGDLLVRSEYFGILPIDLKGVVLIDELDAHLHISLQRKILPFFTRSFPQVQFIVTTHSPFVVSSTDNSLIYDISSGKECEDLSLFSIEHVIEAVLGIPPISQKMQDLISRLSDISNNSDSSTDELKKLLTILAPHADSLDDESRMFYEIAQNKYLSKKRADQNV